MVALAGVSARWSSGPALTVSVAELVLPASVPVTVCEPAVVAVQVAPLQEPSGAIVKVVLAVTSPSELLYWSRPSAVYACDPPEAIVAEAGESAKWSSAPAVTLNEAVAVLPPSLPVTVCAPATVAVQALPVQEPFGPIENVVDAVTSPSEFPDASKPWAVYVCEPPALIVAVAGRITMWSSVPVVTLREAVPVFPDFLPVTVCAPATDAVQVAPVQEPSGAIVKVVVDVTSPSELLYWSR